MKRLVLFLVTAFFFVNISYAAVTIASSSRTFEKEGGAASIVVNGTGSWTTSTNVSWITLYTTSGSGSGSCVYIVSVNNTADTRIGEITVGGNLFTVTQKGAAATVSPMETAFDRSGGSGALTVTADAGITWTAASNDDWISLSKTSGTSVGSVDFSVKAYTGVITRVGTITIAGKTVSVTQTGIDVNIEPKGLYVESKTDVAMVTITALATTQWTVTPNVSWISIVDKPTGYGDYSVILAINANPSFQNRTGTVTIGSETLTIEQAGLTDASIAITPTEATAFPQGAYGNVAVYATPDAEWKAESLTSWLTLSEGKIGKGNGNIKYVVSANPTLESRQGQIKITPPSKTPEVDYHTGKGPSYIPRKRFTGAERYTLTSGYSTMCITFSVGVLNRVNRLMTYRGIDVYLDTDNRLVVDGAKVDFTIDEVDVEYTFFFVGSGYNVKVYGGKTGVSAQSICQFRSDGTSSSSNFGYSGSPTSGYLLSGWLWEESYWNREFTEKEVFNYHLPYSCQEAPDYQPNDCAWTYFPLNSGCYSITSSGSHTSGYSSSAGNLVNDRFGVRQQAQTAVSYAEISRIHDDEVVTISLWVKFSEYGSRLMQGYFHFYDRGWKYYTTPRLVLELTSGGYLSFDEKICSTHKIELGEWYLLTLVKCGAETFQVYLNNEEIRNLNVLWLTYDNDGVSSPCPYAELNIGSSDTTQTLDDIVIYDKAFSYQEVCELYEASRVKTLYHTVTQGVQKPLLDKTSVSSPAEGSTASVNLTLAQQVNWTAKSNKSWIEIVSDTTGAGSNTIDFMIAANPSVYARSGSITVAGINVEITQEGLWADVTCTKDNFGVLSDSGTILVNTEGGAQWQASTSTSWITLLTTSGSGPGNIMFVVDDYTSTTASRTGKITVAGKTILITQCGYELSIEPMYADLGSNAGAGEFGVAAPIDAVWEAISDCDWIVITSQSVGIGEDRVTYQVTDNTTGKTRVGHIVIAGTTYTVTQKTTVPVVAETVGMGYVQGTGDYNQGASVTLIATPANGYVFSHWSGDAVGNDSEVTITADTSKTVTATFIPESVAQKLAEEKAAQGGFYTRDQIHALEMGNLVFDVDSNGTARVGVQLMETDNLSDPDSWAPVELDVNNLDIGSDGTVGMKVPAKGKTRFFKIVIPKSE